MKLGPLSIRWYGLLIATAVLIGVILSQELAKRRNVNPELLGDLFLVVDWGNSRRTAILCFL